MVDITHMFDKGNVSQGKKMSAWAMVMKLKEMHPDQLYRLPSESEVNAAISKLSQKDKAVDSARRGLRSRERVQARGDAEEERCCG